MYRLYDRDPEYLEEVERLLTIIHDIKPSFAPMLAAYSILRRQQGRFEEAETFAKQLLALEPELEVSHLGLGFLYSETDRCELAIPCYEEGLRLKPDNLSSHWGLVILYDRVRDAVGRVRAAERSLPYFEKHNRLFPDDTHSAVCYANLLFYAEQNDKAAEALERVPEIRDGNPLFNLACLAAKLGRPELAINFLQRSSAAGYAEFESYHSDPDLDSLRERQDFLTLVAEMDAKHGH
jgi:tetratricopeptide (TPR) repeat protein